MNPAPLLHGSAGYLDELLICGGGMAVFLVIYFFALVHAKDKETPDKPKDNKTTMDEKQSQ